ncbi:hypothetical protein NX794_03200 [Streptomyces sp. LP11]|uniref:Uncharacterized protein n=1 Tax=Streptomyces pyxinicus TaxID=2970331 RepID=A0ABT2AVG6_9ACTN|nr:hypothetical protein [Streptomyces sp. LP11]MCS0600246.1 hypothetical protein [Streptomyces sp. LP11]
MNDDEIRARFDGRGQVEIRLGLAERARAERVAHALGYRLLSRDHIGRWTYRHVFQRDDDPRARRRAERTVERLRAGGPVLADDREVPPPLPAPPPAPTRRPPAPRPRRSMEPRPPPPVGPPGPRVPPRPPYPPPPPPPGSAR